MKINLEAEDVLCLLENLLRNPLLDKNEQERIVSSLKEVLYKCFDQHRITLRENSSLVYANREQREAFYGKKEGSYQKNYEGWREAQEKRIEDLKRDICSLSPQEET